MRRTAKAALATAVLAAAITAGCGSSDESGTGSSSNVTISADSPPVGDPSLDRGSGNHVLNRVAVTPKGLPAAVYALKIKDVTPGSWVAGRGSLTVTKCAHTDYDPTARAVTGCVGTKHYHYDPVKVTSQLKLVPDDHGKPDLNADGIAVSQPESFDCTTAEHHCVPIAIGETQIESDQVPEEGADYWLVLSLEGSSPNASECKHGAKPSQCEVLAVESQKYTAMYGGISQSGPPEGTTLPRDESVDVKNLPTVDDRDPRATEREVVYSVELAPKEGIEDLVGDQLRVDAQFGVNENENLAPLISGYIVLADSPTSIKGRYLSSDTYDAARTGDTGQNCTGKCTYIKPAAATPITKCDVKAERRYVNLVADSVRTAAKPGESVPVDPSGGFLEVLSYPGSGAEERSDCKDG